MCGSTVFLRDGGEEKILMREVAAVRPEQGRLVLTSVLGERLELDAIVAELDVVAHRIVVERAPGRPRSG